MTGREFARHGFRHYAVRCTRDGKFGGSLHVWVRGEIELADKIQSAAFAHRIGTPGVIVTIEDDTPDYEQVAS